MTMSDPIADLLTRIRNANMARHESVEIPASKTKLALVKILKEEGFVRDFRFRSGKRYSVIKVFMKYGYQKERIISGIKRISKPGLRVYAQTDDLPKVLGGLGIAIVSTSQGIMTDKLARQKGIGGEVLCYVW